MVLESPPGIVAYTFACAAVRLLHDLGFFRKGFGAHGYYTQALVAYIDIWTLAFFLFGGFESTMWRLRVLVERDFSRDVERRAMFRYQTFSSVLSFLLLASRGG